MSKIVITMEVDDDYADPDHEMGVTNEGYEEIIRRLSAVGYDIDVERAT
jgi:hypothetical protein